MLEVCDICSTNLKTRQATPSKPYHYTESGVDVVFLVGVECFCCPTCDLEVAAIPDIDGLHKLIAEGLLSTPEPLTPREFMYLRKEALIGLPELSRRSGVEREVFKKFESNEVPSLRKPLACDFDPATRTWSFRSAQESGAGSGDPKDS